MSPRAGAVGRFLTVEGEACRRRRRRVKCCCANHPPLEKGGPEGVAENHGLQPFPFASTAVARLSPPLLRGGQGGWSRHNQSLRRTRPPRSVVVQGWRAKGPGVFQNPRFLMRLDASPLTRPSGTLSPKGRGELRPGLAFFRFPSPLWGEGSGVRGRATPRGRRWEQSVLTQRPTFHYRRLPFPNSLAITYTSTHSRFATLGSNSRFAHVTNGRLTHDSTFTSGSNSSPTPFSMKTALNPSRWTPTSR